MAKNKYTKVGAVMKRKDDGSTYIKFSKDIKNPGNLQALASALAKAGDGGLYLNVQNPRTSLDEAVQMGHLTADVAETMKAKIPDYVLFELILSEPL